MLKLISEVLELSGSEAVTWAIDLNAGGTALMSALLTDHEQKVLYSPGRTVHHASGSYRGDGRTDAKDALVIADQARMRWALQAVHRGDDVPVDLPFLTSRRLHSAADSSWTSSTAGRSAKPRPRGPDRSTPSSPAQIGWTSTPC
ncbi:IS110 family transposase [Streptomyces tauricus]|uniref:IS110 family transposase n=1 Tax=Streptomyces tauricus TaxID=68274 RepID=UPI0037FADFFA